MRDLNKKPNFQNMFSFESQLMERDFSPARMVDVIIINLHSLLF